MGIDDETRVGFNDDSILLLFHNLLSLNGLGVQPNAMVGFGTPLAKATIVSIPEAHKCVVCGIGQPGAGCPVRKRSCLRPG